MKRKYLQPQSKAFSFEPVLMTVTSMPKDPDDKVTDEDEILSREDKEGNPGSYDLWADDEELDDGLFW